MRSTAFSSFPRSPHQLSISATGQIGKQIGSWMGQDYNPYESEYKISEMINPDGSVTVRKRILNPDGSSRILQQEYSSLDRRILGKIDNETYEEELLPTLDRSFSGSESSPARTLSSDRSGQGSAFSIQRTEQLVMDHSFERVRQSADIPTSLRRSNIEDSYWTPDEAAAEEDPDEGESQSSMSSIPMDASGDSPKLVGLQRPTNPVPFERKFMTDPSILSIISSGINETDISAISGDSMGYPVADTSTALHEEHNEISDDDTLWSLLNDDEPAEASSNSITRGIDGENIQQLPPYGQKITPVAAQGTPARHSDRSSMSKGSSSSAKKSLHSDLIILKQATVIEKPKPHVRYYVDPKISGNRDRLRAQGALFDIPESAQDTSSVNSTPEEHIVVTVRKQSLNDKIGVFVGVCQLPCGPRLVVTKVSPSGKFAESPIENGDIVVSINGKNFLDNPNSEEALGK